MLEVLQADYVAVRGPRVCASTGCCFVHVARNAIMPTLTLLGINIAFLIGATVVVERVFQLNGLGSLMLTSISNRDFPVVQGVTFVFALGRSHQHHDRSRRGEARPPHHDCRELDGRQQPRAAATRRSRSKGLVVRSHPMLRKAVTTAP